jgi:hypothetical protein
MKRNRRNRRTSGTSIPPIDFDDLHNLELDLERQLAAAAKKSASNPDSPSLHKAYKKAYLYACLMPVFGFVPSVMTFISKRGDRQQQQVSKVSLILLAAWLLIYAGSGAVGSGAEGVQVTSQLLQGTLSSFYFGVSVWLMYRLAKGKQVDLPWQAEPDQELHNHDKIH